VQLSHQVRAPLWLSSSPKKIYASTLNLSIKVSGFDERGFFLRCGFGCGSHQGHPPPLENSLATTRKALLDPSEIESLKCLGGAQANAGVGRNFLFNKTGKFISTSQVRYIYSQPWKLPRSTDAGRPFDDLDVATPPCQLLETFRRRDDICYSCLFSDAHQVSGMFFNCCHTESDHCVYEIPTQSCCPVALNSEQSSSFSVNKYTTGKNSTCSRPA